MIEALQEIDVADGDPVINSAALRFIHRDDMESEGYGAYLDQVEDR